MSKKSKTKWLAGYGSFLDWYIVPATPENENLFKEHDGDTYASFSEAKKAVMAIVRDRIADDRTALNHIRKTRKPTRDEI